LGQDRIHLLNLDASQIAARKLAITVDSEIGGRKISGSLTLNETSSPESQVHLLARKIDAAALNKYAGCRKDSLRGEIARIKVSMVTECSILPLLDRYTAAHLDNFRKEELGLIVEFFQLSARDGQGDFRVGRRHPRRKPVFISVARPSCQRT